MSKSLGPPNSVQRVETMVEISFVLCADPDTKLRSVDASGGEVFHVLLGGGGEFDLVYIYDGEGSLVGT
ncbi:hypothetical protein [Cystobacter fuscus]|uniref:hypothetical protein n=1 Tax=Cystobacter fuscus TaxID=43 RepID=UPI0012FE6682|nr:hypothetical protein [Cystobacter fuscus]